MEDQSCFAGTDPYDLRLLDGKVWRKSKGEVEAWVPVVSKFADRTGDGKTIKAELIRVKETLYPPKEEVSHWLDWLRQAPGEMGGYIMRKDGETSGGKTRPPLWGWFMPKQEASMGFWKTVGCEEALEYLGGKGWRVMGSVHTHPGTGNGVAPHASGIDDRAWIDDPGIHLIGWRRGEKKVSVNVSVLGATFLGIGEWDLPVGVCKKGTIYSQEGLGVEDLIVKPPERTLMVDSYGEGWWWGGQEEIICSRRQDKKWEKRRREEADREYEKMTALRYVQREGPSKGMIQFWVEQAMGELDKLVEETKGVMTEKQVRIHQEVYRYLNKCLG